VIAALVILFASTAAFASTPQGTFERTLQVSGPVDLEVLTHSGDVTVRAGSSGSILIRGKIYVGDRWFGGRRDDDVHAIEQNPPIRQSGNSVHIDYVDYRNISVDYEITVPADTTIRSHTGSGDQIVEGTRGNADVQTGSGDVKLSNLTGEIHLQTGSGDVRAHSISGAVHGGTGSGNIEIEETASGDIDLHTGSGKRHCTRYPGRLSRRNRQRRRHRRRNAVWNVGNSNRFGQRARTPAQQCRFRSGYFDEFRQRRCRGSDRNDRARSHRRCA
jgi:hypothetical protein